MDWVKKNWIVLVCGLLAVAGIAIGVWSLMGFSQIQAEANTIAGIAGQLKSAESGAANEPMIIEARKYLDRANKGTNDARDKALAVNKRNPLRDDVFPEEKAADSGYKFRDDYRAAMRKLPSLLNAGKAPTMAVVEAIIHRMEDKNRKEAKLTDAGGELHVPRPPTVQPWVPAAPTTPVGTPGAGPMDDRRMDEGMDPSRGRMDEGMDPSRTRGPSPTTPMMRPGAVPGTPAVALPTRDQLLPEAKRQAVYQAARSIWTYISDDSFEMHPIGLPTSVTRPVPEDLWAAQMFLWLEQDVAQALRRVNEQAIKDQNLPAEQQWVENLPVKHLVTMRISEYLAQTAADATGHSVSFTLLRRGGTGALPPGGVPFGNAGVSFTGRSRTGEYDVVHFWLNLVVDARDLPRILAALYNQNFYTPILVQYRNVDVLTAREGGYLYGSGPIINVDIVCEALFFRSQYEAKMPQIVKDALDGKVVAADPTGGGMMR